MARVPRHPGGCDGREFRRSDGVIQRVRGFAGENCGCNDAGVRTRTVLCAGEAPTSPGRGWWRGVDAILPGRAV